jgi:hypothetical protein
MLPLALAAGGTAASIFGGLLGQKDAEEDKRARTEARMASLRRSLARQDAFSGEARGYFDTRMGDYAPGVQDTRLTSAQGARTNAITSNITVPTADDVTYSRSAPDVVRGALAKRMLGVFNDATERAKAAGALGGYGDTWQGNALGVADTGRRIATVNDFSRQEAALLPMEQDLAEAGAAKKPSMWGPILQAGGNLATSFAGRGGF